MEGKKVIGAVHTPMARQRRERERGPINIILLLYILQSPHIHIHIYVQQQNSTTNIHPHRPQKPTKTTQLSFSKSSLLKFLLPFSHFSSHQITRYTMNRFDPLPTFTNQEPQRLPKLSAVSPSLVTVPTQTLETSIQQLQPTHDWLQICQFLIYTQLSLLDLCFDCDFVSFLTFPHSDITFSLQVMEETSTNSSQNTSQITSQLAIRIAKLASIFEDPEMPQEFLPSNLPTDSAQEQKYAKKIQENSQLRPETDKEEERTNVSRLEIEIRKNNLAFIPLPGQLFLSLVQAELEGRSRQERGKLLLTNYRVLFFAGERKRVDLPFGLIERMEFLEKCMQLVCHLKYPHQWKFFIAAPLPQYVRLRAISLPYFRPANPSLAFAIQYALKTPSQPSPFDLQAEYQYLGFNSNPDFRLVDNTKAEISQSSPALFWTARLEQPSLLASHRRNRRLPMLAYLYTNLQSKLQVPMWITSNYEDKQIDPTTEKELLRNLKCGLPLKVFAVDSKQQRDENTFLSSVQVHLLKLDSKDELRTAESLLMEVFLQSKKPFIKEVLATKWYQAVARTLDAALQIRNHLLAENAVLVRCETGTDYTLVLASLAQLMLTPRFRTFEGFQALTNRLWVEGGHQFASRLGEGPTSQAAPFFLLFLDCVSQIVVQNPSHFEFNLKFLAKLANLMRTNIYGNFLADSPHQRHHYGLPLKTADIWPDLKTSVTTNGFYEQKGGTVGVHGGVGALRLWRQHFGELVTRSRDHYKLKAEAQDNSDYLNLEAQSLRSQNEVLKAEVKQRLAELHSLQQIYRQRTDNP